MSMGLRDRLRAGLGTMEEWRRDRLADLANGATELEAQGHQLYGESIRKGQDFLARTTSELRELAKAHGVSPTGHERSTATRPAATQSSIAKGPTRDQQIFAAADRIMAEAQRNARATLKREGESRIARSVAGHAAGLAGNAVGAATEAVDMGRTLVDGAVFGARLLDPTESFRKPRGEAAWDELFGGLGAFGSDAVGALMDPRGATRNLLQKGDNLLRDTVPLATPQASTLSGEITRRFEIGKRQGELLAGAVPYAIGVGELKTIAGLGAMSKARLLEKYKDQGFTRRDANRLAKPYDGMGHHSILPARARFPEWLGGAPVPKAILDSPFNVVKPPHISQGEFYELHAGLDRHWKGTKVRKDSWSAKKLGLQRYDLAGRIWHGTPNATRQAIAGAGIAGTFQSGDPEPR